MDFLSHTFIVQGLFGVNNIFRVFWERSIPCHNRRINPTVDTVRVSSRVERVDGTQNTINLTNISDGYINNSDTPVVSCRLQVGKKKKVYVTLLCKDKIGTLVNP